MVPDLEWYVNGYMNRKESNDEEQVSQAAIEFMKGTCLRLEESRSTIRRRLIDSFRGSGHRWMWDYASLAAALAKHGFVDIKRFTQGESDDEMFLRCERDHMFGDENGTFGLPIQCVKP